MATKYYISELFPGQKFNAAVGRKDLEQFLDSWGFVRLDFQEEKAGLRAKAGLYYTLLRFTRRIKPGDSVLFHLPLYSRAKRLLLKFLRRKNIHCIAYVNDMEGLRDKNDRLLSLELQTLSLFSGAIVLNKTMQQYVAERCLHLCLSAITIWDYSAKKIPDTKRQKAAVVAFAGNQNKARFIEQLQAVSNVTLHLYGTPVLTTYPLNCVVHGEVDAKELPNVIQGSFGLVWDGPSVEGCLGGEGQYLRINSPYKLSLYLLAGMPVVIWKEAALASWVTGNGYGIAVEDLRTLDQAIGEISDADYQNMVNRIKEVQPLIASGRFLKTALNKQFGEQD